ncbi:hypothetical protein PV05_05384 [Exophiala xenobiotica]|uniref:Uncharacterized protein n=1 Tax=Exophiala xenobiotica TaxID=348802 RepID=A0A0D2F9P7_9EURO|nr:uncharacterized protein PV05_05384 [Exophiala xenobiotica]KIW56749.1 hypothetical protein PV05_05384 [Exophiala xenobiotica]
MAECDDQYDLFTRPPTPPDSPLRWKFTPKELANLRHVPTPPGIERPEADENDLGTSPPSKSNKPKVPLKPPNLEAFFASAAMHDSPPEATTKQNDFMESNMSSSYLSQPQCLNNLPENVDRAFSSSEPYFHRHETVYKRVVKHGEPVETMTQTCEISGLDPSERLVEECEEQPDEKEEILEAVRQDINAEQGGETETTMGPHDDDEFAGLFV